LLIIILIKLPNLYNFIGQEKDNILLIDKPKGITSFDVIRELRKKLGKKKMGHYCSYG